MFHNNTRTHLLRYETLEVDWKPNKVFTLIDHLKAVVDQQYSKLWRSRTRRLPADAVFCCLSSDVAFHVRSSKDKGVRKAKERWLGTILYYMCKVCYCRWTTRRTMLVTSCYVSRRSGVRKVSLCLCDPSFSHLCKTLSCDRQMDTQTDRHTDDNRTADRWGWHWILSASPGRVLNGGPVRAVDEQVPVWA